MNMIPKLIHYCWLSEDPYPKSIKEYIDNWKILMPDYRFILWDKKQFDLDSSIWVRQAYDNKKYAFAADYIRLYALYNYGGIYLDTDVEVLKRFDDLLNLPYFIGLDSQSKLEAAIIGSEAKSDWILDCLRYYNDRQFVSENKKFDMTPLPGIMEKEISRTKKIISVNTNYINNYNVLNVFPFDFFCSKRHDNGCVVISENTYTIHHFAMSWKSNNSKRLTMIKRFLVKILGSRIVDIIISIFFLKKILNKV